MQRSALSTDHCPTLQGSLCGSLPSMHALRWPTAQWRKW